jgi:hypothetical protein
MAEGVPRAHPSKVGFKIGAKDASFNTERERGFVNLKKTIEAGEIQRNSTSKWNRTSADSASTSNRSHGNPSVVAKGQYG